MNNNFFQAGEKLSRAFAKTLNEIKPGISLAEIEKKAVRFIEAENGQPGFKTVDNYHWATCINVNNGVVHGVPNDTEIKTGDLVSLDMGLIYKGWHGDMAYTKLVDSQKSIVKSDKEEIIEFLEAGERALEKAIKQVKSGNRIGDISRVIEEVITGAGYQVVKRLTGHGIGRKLHQQPLIPGFLSGPVESTPLIKKNMGLAIEVIYTKGKGKIKTADDGWTITTQDGKISALFEKTVLASENGVKIITPYLF